MAKTKKDDIKKDFRPPVVAVLGHVDHGKTTLLDTIRKSNIAGKEFGGITQHIGAYQVEVPTKDGIKNITFIDTPGHETFTKIRSRGASIADIAILVVSVADGVQPQTIESIKLIKEANIPFIVAITKIDVSRNLETVKKQLAKNEVLVEGFGGDVVYLGVSAKTGEGLQELLEMIVLVAEMNELKAKPEDQLMAVVIESQIDKRRGVEANVIIKSGSLRVGDTIYASGQQAKIRAVINDKGQNIDMASVSMPVKLLGFTKPPLVGEVLKSTPIIVEIPQEKAVSTESSEEVKKLNIILKADTNNSLEAILLSLPMDNLKIISQGLGDITESDIFLAKTTRSFIIGFNVKPSDEASRLASFEKVRIKTYQIIYKLLEELKEVLESYTTNNIIEELGSGQVIAEFPFNNKKIAGIKVTEGRIAKGDYILLKRDDTEVGRAVVKSIRRFKQETNKVEVGGDCGILIDPNLDFRIGDMVVSVLS